MQHTHRIVATIQRLLAGAVDPDPAIWGATADDEWAALDSRKVETDRWPGVSTAVTPPNASLKMYGGAAFERAVIEFQCAAAALPFPKVSKEKIANVSMMGAANGLGGETAAREVAQVTAKEFLSPLLDTCCDRLSGVLQRLLDIALASIQAEDAVTSHRSRQQRGSSLAPMLQSRSFEAELRAAFSTFVKDVTESCRDMAHNQVQSITAGSLALSMDVGRGGSMASGAENIAPQRDYGSPSVILTQEADDGMSPLFPGCEREPLHDIQDSQATMLDITPIADKRAAKVHGREEEVQGMARRIYSGLRDAAVQHALPAIFHSSLLNNFKDQLAPSMFVGLFSGQDQDVLNLFADLDLEALSGRCQDLRDKAASLAQCEVDFKNLQ